MGLQRLTASMNGLVDNFRKDILDDDTKKMVYALVKKSCSLLSYEGVYRIKNEKVSGQAYLRAHQLLKGVEQDRLIKYTESISFSPKGLTSKASIIVLREIANLIDELIPLYVWPDYHDELKEFKDEIESLIVGLQISQD